ncbi:hypothetical protein P9222_30815 [Paenibacillus amylolyticus]|nr:hypothetical protein [Paenibacillus amylolyticus]WFR62520.1 hypothetical protein P9222_30815 [Paenibacillus amylolyticus]
MRKGNRLPFKYIFVTVACFAIASIGLYGMLILSSNSAQSGEDQPPSSQMELSGLHMTTDEFHNKFNSAVGKYRLNGLSITRLDIQDSSEKGNGTFEYAFNDELRLVGVLNADRSIQEISLYSTGDSSQPTGGILLTAIATLILTTHSEYTYNDAQDVIQDMGLLNRDVNQIDFDGATVRNGFKYRFSIQDHNQSTFEISVAK